MNVNYQTVSEVFFSLLLVIFPLYDWLSDTFILPVEIVNRGEAYKKKRTVNKAVSFLSSILSTKTKPQKAAKKELMAVKKNY